MLRAIRLLAVAIAALTSIGCAAGRTKTSEPADVTVVAQHLDTVVPTLLRRYHVPGATVAIVHNGALAWARGYGWADVAAHRRADADTAFEVGSMSKTVSAWGVLHVVEAERLNLDAPVDASVRRWHLPPSRDAHRVTLRRLLSHTSGLTVTSYFGHPEGRRLPPLVDVLDGTADGPRLRVTRPPGRRFSYSDGNYALLQLFVEDATGRPFSEYMKDHVLHPLGMTRSSYEASDLAPEQRAIAYSPRGRVLPTYVFTEQAPDGLFTTAGDYGRFLAAGFPGPDNALPGRGVLSPDATRLLTQPAPNTVGADELGRAGHYGFGYVVERDGGRSLVWHPGSNRGWASLFVASPSTRDGLVLLTNSDAGDHMTFDVGCWWAKRAEGSDLPLCNAFARGGVVVTILTAMAALALLWGALVRLRRPRRPWRWRKLVGIVVPNVAIVVWLTLWNTSLVERAVFHVDDLPATTWMPRAFAIANGMLVVACLVASFARATGGDRTASRSRWSSLPWLAGAVLWAIVWWSDLLGTFVLGIAHLTPAVQYPVATPFVIAWIAVSLVLGALTARRTRSLQSATTHSSP